MRAFLCSIDDNVWDAIKIGWTRSEAAKSNWDKAALAAVNAKSKALNAIFLFFFFVSHPLNCTGFHMLQLPRRHGKFWRPHMKAPRR